MSDVKRMEDFMKENTQYCSFTYWPNTDNAIVDYSQVRSAFSDKFILVGLNPTASCHAFHSNSPQDGRLKKLFRNNVYYITDLIKHNYSRFTAKNSKAVVKEVRSSGLINNYIGILKDEISFVGGNPTIIAFGDAVYELLLENRCSLCNCRNPVKIEKVPHFSAFNLDKLEQRLKALGVIQ